MKKWIVFVTIFLIGFVAKAQYGGGPDRYFYDEDFDWRWDVRVRISDGYRSGYLTSREANRLYKRLEDIERKEWAYQADGYYSVWEQEEIWLDIIDLNRRIGIELSDWDRRYYGYNGIVITGRSPWYFGTTYDFYRFDRRGYGSISIGYAPRPFYPVRHVYYTHSNNYSSNWNNHPSRVAVPSRGNSSRVPSRSYESSRTSNPRNYNNSRTNDFDYNHRNSGNRSSSSPSGYERSNNSRNSSLENSRNTGSSTRNEAPRSESNTRNNSSSSNSRVQTSRSTPDTRATSTERSSSNNSGGRTATRSNDSSSGRGRN